MVVRSRLCGRRTAAPAAVGRARTRAHGGLRSTSTATAPGLINKTDLATLIGADFAVMARDSRKMRGDAPFLFAQVTNGIGVKEIAVNSSAVGRLLYERLAIRSQARSRWRSRRAALHQKIALAFEFRRGPL